MRICLISYDIQDFGGLEEYAVNLAIGLKQQGHDVGYLSAAWVAPENQYSRRLKERGIPLVQPPKWISGPASDWQVKERILRGAMRVCTPLTLLMGLGVSILKKRSWRGARTSAYNWLKGQLMNRCIGRDYRRSIGILLLSLWNLRRRPDIIHIQGYTTTLLFAIDWAHTRGIPVVYEEHQTPDPQFNWWKGFENIINKADRVIAVSEKSAQGLRDVCRVTRPIVVRGPLMPDPFKPGWEKDWKSRNNGKYMVTTVARLYVTKGLSYLLDVAAIVKGTHPDVEFAVYGEGELRDGLMLKAEALGLNGREIFKGAFSNRDELTSIMAGTDIFLLSSVLEGQPLAIVEAMAFGCPIVSTNVGGIPELITDGVNGLLCPPENPQCLAEKILMLVENPDLLRRLSRAARASYEKSPFQAEAVARFFSDVYSEVIDGRKS